MSRSITKVYTFWCDSDIWKYYSFSPHGLYTYPSFFDSNIAGPKQNLAGPTLSQLNKFMNRVKNRGEKWLRVNRPMTSICSQSLSWPTSDSADSRKLEATRVLQAKPPTATWTKPIIPSRLAAPALNKNWRTGPIFLLTNKILKRNIN